MSLRDGSFKWIPAGAGMTEGSWKLEVGIPMFIPEILRDKLRLRRLEAGSWKLEDRRRIREHTVISFGTGPEMGGPVEGNQEAGGGRWNLEFWMLNFGFWIEERYG